MKKTVECFSGVEYAEQPRRFLWQGDWRTVRQIAAESRTPDSKQFEVLDDSGEKFHLTYRPSADCWIILPAG
jgi:hypothetical protein